MSIVELRNEGASAEGLPTFESEAREVLARFRKALSDLIAALPGGVRRAVDLQRALGVDAKTSWRLFKIASASDPLGIGSHVPGRQSMQRVRAGATRRQVPGPLVHAVEYAFDDFEALVKRYAGDRTTFDSMVSMFGQDDSNQLDLTHRRAAFRANSHIWGVQSRVQLITHIFRRSTDDPDRFDALAMQGSYGLTRLRRDAAWTIAEVSARHDEGSWATSEPRPLESDSDDPTGFLAEFSSPSPQLRVTTRAAGFSSVELGGDLVGIPSSSTYLFAHVMRRVAPWYHTKDDSYVRSRATVRTPTECLHYDLLIDEETFGRVDPETFLMSDLARDQSVTNPRQAKSHQLPVCEVAARLGIGTSVLHTPELPRYTEMIEKALARLGWSEGRFQVFRLRMEYPVLPSSHIVEFPLPTSG